MIDKGYSSGGFLNSDCILREVEVVKFVISETKYNANSGVVSHMSALETALKKVERTKKWQAIGEYHRN